MKNSNYPFLKKATEGKNEWWRYLITSIVPILVMTTSHIILSDKLPLNEPFKFYISFGISSILTLATTILFVIYLHKKKLKSTITSAFHYNKSMIFYGFAIWFLFVMVYNFVFYLIAPNDFTITFNSNLTIPVLIMVFIFVPIKTTWEEILFRGLLMQGFSIKLKNPIYPILITSALFAVIHGIDPVNLFYTFSFGVAFGYITVRNNSSELAIGAHAANNIFSYVFLRNASAQEGEIAYAFVTQSGTTFDYFEPLLVIPVGLALFLLITIYRTRKATKTS